MKLAVFDFDHTLFDTDAFKKELFSGLGVYDVPYQAVVNAYNKLMQQKGKFTYDYAPRLHLSYLRKRYDFPVKSAEQRMASVLKKSDKFLFPGAKEVLRGLKKKGFYLVLVSRGSENFTKQKIYNSGIADFFDKVRVTKRSKLDLINSYIKKADLAWVVNDNLKEIAVINKANRGVNCIRVSRNDHPLPIGSSLREISKLPKLLHIIK